MKPRPPRQFLRIVYVQHDISLALRWVSYVNTRVTTANGHTSIELNGLPLYASANSFATVRLLNFMTTIERFGAESLVRGSV